MNIVLLGYRGTGKSTVAGLLSQMLKRELFDIDALIARSAGMSIPRIVEREGWPRFRELEAQAVRQAARDARDAVIDCGGGVVLNQDNVAVLRKTGRTAVLTASFETILRRIERDPNRPPLKAGMSFEEEQRQALAEREPLYRAAADLVCDTSRVASEKTAREIIGHFAEKGWI
jgi:shikimate kinase